MVRYYIDDVLLISVCITLEILIIAPWGISSKLEPNTTIEFIRYDTQLKFSDTVQLKCKLSKKKHCDYLNGVYEINWEYKRCGFGLDLIPCHDPESKNIPWKPFMCKNHKNQEKPCENSLLILKNLTKFDSGLYRCNYKYYMSKDFKVFKVFHLNVIDPKAEEYVQIVEDEPDMDNQTVYVNAPALLRCRVRSLSLVSIMWARPATEENNVSSVKVSDKSCEFLRSPRTVKVYGDTYVSKLRIPSCKMADSGYYYCVVIPFYNANATKIIKSVSLTVLPPMKSEIEAAPPSLLWVLMVIPILSFMVAACVCFIKISCKFKTEDSLSKKLTSF